MTVFRKLSLRQPGVSHEILAALEPEIFNEETAEHDEEELMYLVCRLLKIRKDTRLPSITHNVPHEVPALIAALSQHYRTKGGLPFHLKSLAALLKGYFVSPDEDGKTLVCTVDTKEKKTVLGFEYADELEVVNSLDVQTELRVTTNGRTASVDSVAQEFSDDGVEMPQLLADWKGDLFGEKLPETTPQKRKAEHSPSPPAASNAFASKSSVLVGAALRRKVSQPNLDDASLKKEKK